MVKDESNYEKLTTPCCAFITFESDDGQVEALQYSKFKKWYQMTDKNDPYQGFERKDILGERAHFIAATEPTNIQWENRHIKGINYYRRITAAVLMVIMILALSFGAIVGFKIYSIRASDKYPPVD